MLADLALDGLHDWSLGGGLHDVGVDLLGLAKAVGAAESLIEVLE